jgi:hypothetical protein
MTGFGRNTGKAPFPRLKKVTWPQSIPFFALSSGTSTGNTKYIPLSRQTLAFNTKAGADLLAWHLAQRPQSRLLGGRSLVLGGSTKLETLAPGVRAGDLSGIASLTMPWYLRAWYYPPKKEALLSDWQEKIDRLARLCLSEDIRSISGVPSWMQIFISRLGELKPEAKGKLAGLLPNLELVVHGGVNFEPYAPWYEEALAGSRAELKEVYPASEGFIAHSGGRADLGGLGLLTDHGIFYEFVPLEELGSKNPTRHWVGNLEKGVNYAVVITTCSGLWSYILGDTVRFVRANPPRLVVTGRTSWSLSAFGEHLIAEEVEDAMSLAAKTCGAILENYCMGAKVPRGTEQLGRHLAVVEFLRPPKRDGLAQFALDLDKRLTERNADYRAHREKGFGLDAPVVWQVEPGSFSAWMESRGKLGGQNKVPRLVPQAELLEQIIDFMAPRRVGQAP